MNLPSGTVTFLFTDIEGSTRLLHELGPERYADALAEHRRVLREAFDAFGGVEVDTQGDAFFVAFRDAAGALAAAGKAQKDLANGQTRVRMGIHSGEPLLTDEGYVGMDVHQGARVMGAGHGGQILVSQATRSLVPGDGLVELGLHRLKDLTEPQPLYQLGAGEFPPLKTLYQSNLPVQPTPLVGRDAELAELLSLLRESRLVTLTGAGGSGKTRLALQAAAELVDDLPDGVWWISLASLRDPELVEPTIRQVVGAKEDLQEHLRGRRALLLLDNFEHLLAAVGVVSEVLAGVTGVTILATSRERLGIAVEQEYPVPTMVEDDAVALFTTRARQLVPRFVPDDAVGTICRRLDGLPLAVELAAARVKVLSPAQILDRLGRRLSLLTSGARDAPERQRTLRAAIDWSNDLLDADEQRLFAELSVFAGGFDYEAAETVCNADLDTLAGLVDKSLVRQAGERFFLLETIHEYALERAEAAGVIEEMRCRHAAYFLDEAEQGDLDARFDLDKTARVERDEANFRAALEWITEEGTPDEAMRMCLGLALFWEVRDRLVEGNRRFARVLEATDAVDPSLRGRVLIRRALFALHANDYSEVLSATNESLAIARELGDRRLLAHSLTGLSLHARLVDGDLEQAARRQEEALALFREVGDALNERRSLQLLGEIVRDRGQLDQAAALIDESIELSRAAGDDIFTAAGLHSAGDVALEQGHLDSAEQLYRECLTVARSVGFASHVALALAGLACAAFGRDEPARAAQLWATVEQYEIERGVRIHPHERVRYERGLAALQSSSADALDLDEAVDYALAQETDGEALGPGGRTAPFARTTEGRAV